MAEAGCTSTVEDRWSSRLRLTPKRARVGLSGLAPGLPPRVTSSKRPSP